jgi:hypothetical protein
MSAEELPRPPIEFHPEIEKIIRPLSADNEDATKWHFNFLDLPGDLIEEEAERTFREFVNGAEVDKDDYNNLQMIAYCRSFSKHLPAEAQKQINDPRNYFMTQLTTNYFTNQEVRSVNEKFIQSGKMPKSGSTFDLSDNVIFSLEDMAFFNSHLKASTEGQKADHYEPVLFNQILSEDFDSTATLSFMQYVMVCRGLSKFLGSDTPRINEIIVGLEDGKAYSPNTIWQAFHDDNPESNPVQDNVKDVVTSPVPEQTRPPFRTTIRRPGNP